MGGRYGVLNQNHDIGFDDNITHKLGYGLKLKVEYNRSSVTGLTTVKATIVPAK
jgi:hypothetical protein